MSKKAKDLNKKTTGAGSASVAENAILAKDKNGFPFKKVIFAVVVALLVISLILLVINLVINSYFKSIHVYDGSYEINMEKVRIIDDDWEKLNIEGKKFCLFRMFLECL